MTKTTTTTTNEFDAARAQVETALTAMRSGDPEPYIACFASTQEVTLFGAWGPIEHGHDRLASTFRWVASRFQGGTTASENVAVVESGDVAYTVGFERGRAVVDGRASAPMTIRVTHIYRRLDGRWYLVHRHADFPPADQRQAPAVAAGTVGSDRDGRS